MFCMLRSGTIFFLYITNAVASSASLKRRSNIPNLFLDIVISEFDVQLLVPPVKGPLGW